MAPARIGNVTGMATKDAIISRKVRVIINFSIRNTIIYFLLTAGLLGEWSMKFLTFDPKYVPFLF